MPMIDLRIEARAFLSRPVALEHHVLDRLCTMAGERHPVHHDPQAVTPPRAAAQAGEIDRAVAAVAVIPLKGVITPEPSILSLIFGGADTGGLKGFRAMLSAAVADPEITGIVIDVDSPGGRVDQVPETAALVRDAREQKPIVAVCNTLCASAAYWIAAQAGEIAITPSGAAGSIGVYRVHEDWSGYDEKAGIDTTLISAGRYKTEGNPYEPLGDEATKAWQQDVDDLYGLFVADVAAGRGTTADAVRTGYGEGRVLSPHRAVTAGLCDRVQTLDDAISELLRTAAASSSSSAGAIAHPPTQASPQAANDKQRDRLLESFAGHTPPL